MIRNNDNIVRIYADGACSGNQNDENYGGYGAILEFNGVQKEIYGAEKNTTNNRMELCAVINALSLLKRNQLTVHIFSDSSYVINCFKQRWYLSWQQNDWKNSKKQTVENKALWSELLSLVNTQLCTFYKIKGHLTLDAQSAAFKAAHKKFNEENSLKFSEEEFSHVVSMNHRADALANVGISELKESEQSAEGSADCSPI